MSNGILLFRLIRRLFRARLVLYLLCNIVMFIIIDVLKQPLRLLLKAVANKGA